MNKDELKAIVDTDFPDMAPITEETREQTKRESLRYRGGVRISTGRFWTNEEYKEYREKVLQKAIP